MYVSVNAHPTANALAVPKASQSSANLAARHRKCCRQLRVAEPNQSHNQSTDEECDRGADRPSVVQPATDNDDPPDPDDGTERDREEELARSEVSAQVCYVRLALTA